MFELLLHLGFFLGAAVLVYVFAVTVLGTTERIVRHIPEDPDDAQHLAIVVEWNGSWRKRDGTPRLAAEEGHYAGIYGCFLDADFALMCLREDLASMGWVGAWGLYHIVDLNHPEQGYLEVNNKCPGDAQTSRGVTRHEKGA